MKMKSVKGSKTIAGALERRAKHIKEVKEEKLKLVSDLSSKVLRRILLAVSFCINRTG